MTHKTKPPEQTGLSRGSGARWVQRLWPDGGSKALLPLEKLEDQMFAEDIERKAYPRERI